MFDYNTIRFLSRGFMKSLSSREFKNIVYQELAKVGKALSDPKRMEILDLLGQSDKNVETIARQIGSDKAVVSHHLQALKAAKLVSATRYGRFVYYKATEYAAEIWHLLSSIGEEVSSEISCAVQSFFDNHSHIKELDYDELINQASSGEIIVLDVRPKDEYEAGHLPGARSCPLDELEQNIAKLPQDKKIIAYCRGPYCVLSQNAVNILKEHNIEAYRIPDGVHEWTHQNIQIVSS